MRGLGFLRVLLALSIVSTAIHYTDNYIQLEDYGREGLTYDVPATIPISWVLFTAAGLLGYRMYSQGRLRPAQFLLAFYSISGLISFGHYTVESRDMATWQNVSVAIDGALGLAILTFAIWSAASQRGATRPAAPA